jgi:hypothetical protein
VKHRWGRLGMPQMRRYPLAFAPSRLFGAEALQVVPEFPGH